MVYDQLKERTLAIAHGEEKPASGKPIVWFTSVESFAKVLFERNRELLPLVARENPHLLTELARVGAERVFTVTSG